MDLTPGMTASVERVVDDTDTAVALGSGDVPVLATPRLVALVEEAAVAAVAAALAPESTTVGTSVTMDHLAATPVGGRIVARAVLDEIDGRRLSFAIGATEGDRTIARGTHARFVVDRDRFLAGLGDG